MVDGCVDIVLSLGTIKKYIFWHASFAKKQGACVDDQINNPSQPLEEKLYKAAPRPTPRGSRFASSDLGAGTPLRPTLRDELRLARPLEGLDSPHPTWKRKLRLGQPQGRTQSHLTPRVWVRLARPGAGILLRPTPEGLGPPRPGGDSASPDP